LHSYLLKMSSIAVVFSFDAYPVSNIIETKKYQAAVDNNKVEYTILNYNKEAIQDGDVNNGKYRSVILSDTNTETSSRIICYGIPQSIPIEQWKHTHGNEFNQNDFLVNEIIEGTMINLFYDERCKSWMIATKTTVGGNNYYFKLNYGINETEPEKTFKEMFIEAIGGNPKTDTLNSLPVLKKLQKDFIYSFVLQHPFNHLVLNIVEPKVYLVAIYYVNDENQVQYINERDYEDWSCFQEEGCRIKFPKRVSTTETTLEKLLAANENDRCDNLGVMITHIETGDRCAIKNKNYEYVKQIRGNHPNLKYHYYELLKNNRVYEFIYYFPRYYYLFCHFYTEFMVFAQELHRKYVQYYVKKDETIIPKNFAILRSRLHHEVYLPYKNTGVIVDNNRVIAFLLALETKELYYYITGYDKKMAIANEEVNVQE